MKQKTYRSVNIYSASITVALGAVLASYGETWWAYILGSLGAFNLGAAVVGRHALRWAFHAIRIDLQRHGWDEPEVR
jgi:hypothetical protein